MERVKQVARRVGKVTLVLLGVILMPVLTTVGFGMVVSQKVQAKKSHQKPVPTIGEILAVAGITIQDEAVAAKTFRQQPLSDIHGLLVRAGLTVHDEAAPKHCWEVLDCPTEQREACPVFAHRDVPGWVAAGFTKCEHTS